jgi:hypothetical protein
VVGASVTVGPKQNLYAQASYNAEAGRNNTTVSNTSTPGHVTISEIFKQ